MPMIESTRQVQLGCQTLVHTCAGLKADDKALIISNPQTQSIGEAIEKEARQISHSVKHEVIAPLAIHGQDPPAEIAAEMLSAQVIFAVTKMSIAHSKASRQALQSGARFLSLPDYSIDVLVGGAMKADFQSLSEEANRLAELLTSGRELTLKTELGTDLYCDLDRRSANPAPGWCWMPGTLASPPDAETNIAPIEEATSGVLVVDGSIPCPQIGLLSDPISLTIESGRVTSVSGHRSRELLALFDSAGSDGARIIGEIGFGLNPLAKLSGQMLEDEGCRGTAHVGIGSNATIGGMNDVPFHLDHVVRNVTAQVDGLQFMVGGKIL